MRPSSFPPLPLQEWEPTRLQLQLICQIIGKIRLKLHPQMNHWWHAALYPSPRGFATGDIPYHEFSFDMELDVHSENVSIRTSNGFQEFVPYKGKCIADVYSDVLGALTSLGIEVAIVAKPYKCKSVIPFASDYEHKDYDSEAARRAWHTLLQSSEIFKTFRSRFVGKCSPVHVFWHSFDLAVTRFSGRKAPAMPQADKVTQEAYSHEVNSAGFWFGDDTFPEPAYYCYTVPTPTRLSSQPLAPREAFWQEMRGAPMALLRYGDFRNSAQPEIMLLEFLQSAYEAGADTAEWDRENLEI